jgi:hypothetical protein
LVAQDRDPFEARIQRPEVFELRQRLLRIKGRYPRDVSAGLLQVRGQSVSDRLDDDCENDWNAGGRLADRSHGNRADDGDEVDPGSDHFEGKFRQQVELSLRGSDFKPDALPFDPPKVLQSRLETIHRIGRACNDDADAFHG